MTFDLYSRTVRIGGPDLAPGCGYRDIVIHEVTEQELESLRSQRWMGLAIGFALGLLIGTSWVAYATFPVS